MRLSRLCFQTLREVPKEADTISHQLMVRASLIRQVGSGIYEWLPLGWRAVLKVAAIIREEMDRAGAQEVLLPQLSPRELWEETGRWGQYGRELMRLKDRHERDFALGPTHEEVITDLVRATIRTYRKLPVTLYQMQTKFRDEIRPRFGVMRAREFMMKDAYSFDINEEGAEKSYEVMRVAYNRIFTRLGLKYRMVEADSGLIGGSFSHEFMVLADTGEEYLAVCDKCSFAANLEKAEPRVAGTKPAVDGPAYAEVSTPATKSINAVSKLLNKPAGEIAKLLFYEVDGALVGTMLRGDHALNETKLRKHLGVDELHMAKADFIASELGAPVGYLGPVGLKPVRIIFDRDLALMPSIVTGANKVDTHLTGVVPGRDFPLGEVAQIRSAGEGDGCPRCEGTLKMLKGIEVGHIFKLGTKYSHAMKAQYLSEAGREEEMVMGCYGIGVTRIVASAIEQNHDSHGIIWPGAMAPYGAVVIPLGSEPETAKAAEDIYAALQGAGIEALIDDRTEAGPGVKFNDADLIGIPVQVVVGKVFKAEGLVEVKDRRSGAAVKVKPEAVNGEAAKLLAKTEANA
jgi:prolyl-tRNA synthetase